MAGKFKAGDRFGRHEIVAFVGAGGMGEVYEARHVDLKKREAIKVLIENTAGYTEIRRRFLQEGEAASRIQHPNVVAVFDVGSEGDVAYMVMEYLEGLDLQARLVESGTLSGPALVDLMLPICAAVAAAHDAGVIHRDLKPANIFLAKNPLGGTPVPKILDFGISKITKDPNQGMTVGTAVLGTPQYLAPEQAMNRPGIDARVDQYALGVMMYQCLSNAFPYTGSSMYHLLNAIVQGAAVPIDERVPGLDPRLSAAIARAMHVERGERFPSVRHLGAALLPLASAGAQQNWAGSFASAAEPAAPAVPGPSVPPVAPPVSSPRLFPEPEARPRTMIEPMLASVPSATADQVLPSPTGGPLTAAPAARGWGAIIGGVGIGGLLVAAGVWLTTGAPQAPAVAPDATVLVPVPSPADAAELTPDAGESPDALVYADATVHADARANADAAALDARPASVATLKPTPRPSVAVSPRDASVAVSPRDASVAVSPRDASVAAPVAPVKVATPSPSPSPEPQKTGANNAPILR